MTFTNSFNTYKAQDSALTAQLKMLEARFDSEMAAKVEASVVGSVLLEVANKDQRLTGLLTKIKRAYDHLYESQRVLISGDEALKTELRTKSELVLSLQARLDSLTIAVSTMTRERNAALESVEEVKAQLSEKQSKPLTTISATQTQNPTRTVATETTLVAPPDGDFSLSLSN